MSDRDPDDNRHNDGRPALWRITYKFNQQIRRSVPGTGETEKVGEQIAERHYDVVAVSAAFATATFCSNCPVYSGDLVAGSVADAVFVCYVDAITLTQRYRGGSFCT